MTLSSQIRIKAVLRKMLSAICLITTLIRWLLLKLTSICLISMLGNREEIEILIVQFGNLLFFRQYKDEVFQDFNSYFRHQPPNLDVYYRMLPPESWVKSRRILDIGSGLGQYSAELARRGAALVVGIEYQPKKSLFAAKTILREFPENLVFVNGDAGRLPFRDQLFSSIFSHTVFEHLSDVENVLRELGRVITKDGVILLSFNFFQSQGGHHLFPYIHFPWPTWIVSELTLCRYWSRRLADDQKKGKALFFPAGSLIKNLSEGNEIHLNKMNYLEFESLVKKVGLGIRRRFVSGLFARVFPFLLKIPSLRFFAAETIYYTLELEKIKDLSR